MGRYLTQLFPGKEQWIYIIIQIELYFRIGTINQNGNDQFIFRIDKEIAIASHTITHMTIKVPSRIVLAYLPSQAIVGWFSINDL